MSDPHAEKKDDKHEKKAAAPADPNKPGIKALVGPLAAVVLLVGSGVGIGMFLSGLLAPPKPAETPGEGHGPATADGKDAHGADGHGAEDHGDGKGGDHAAHSLTHAYREFVLDGVIANVRETGGKKFVKVNPVFWITPEAHAAAGLAGGGGHGGGGEAGGEIKRILRARLEEHLREYDMDELTGKGVYKKLEKSFREIVTKEMRAVFPEIKEEKIVEKVLIQGMMVQ